MTLSLTQIPGFSDLPDANLEAEKLSLGVEVAKLASNAAFGMVRFEVFQGIYVDGDSVKLPVSAVDGYNYSRNELTYVWALYNTDNQKTGWITGPDSLWYAAWLVDQESGLVSCVEYYRTSSSTPKVNESNDGQLLVFTLAQRLKTDLTMTQNPIFDLVDDSALIQDAAWSQERAQGLNHCAKFGVVSTEAIYMGEYVTGDTVAQPVSPVDGYVYDYKEVKFLYSWRWTCLGKAFTQPSISLGQLGPQQAAISSTGGVTLNVSYFNSGLSNQSTHGRISVVALCQRRVNQLRVLATSMPWSFAGGKNSSFPIQIEDGGVPSVLPVELQPGDTVTIVASGLIEYDTNPFTSPPGGDSVRGFTGVTGLAYPSTYQSAGTTMAGIAGLVGAWTDDDGNVIEVIGVGLGGTFTVPSGATRLNLGIDDTLYSDNVGYFLAYCTWSPVGRFPLSNTFSDVDVYDFMPGNVLKASDVSKIGLNCNESALSPEVFGPFTKMDGDTVSLPVSDVDGYTYARSELAYLWEWSDTTPTSAGHTMRTAILSASVNNSNGVCSVKVYNLADGGPIVQEGTGFATIRVIVIAMRQQQVTFGSFVLTAVVVNGSTTTYVGTIINGANNEYAGLSFDIAGFSNSGNNVTIKVLSSTNLGLVCTTTTQVNESTTASASNGSSSSAPADAATTPADIPTTSSGQVNGV